MSRLMEEYVNYGSTRMLDHGYRFATSDIDFHELLGALLGELASQGFYSNGHGVVHVHDAADGKFHVVVSRDDSFGSETFEVSYRSVGRKSGAENGGVLCDDGRWRSAPVAEAATA